MPFLVKTQGKSRIDQIVQWLGGPSFDGLLVFDEVSFCESPSSDGLLVFDEVNLYRLVSWNRCAHGGMQRRIRGDVLPVFQRSVFHSMHLLPSWIHLFCRGRYDVQTI